MHAVNLLTMACRKRHDCSAVAAASYPVVCQTAQIIADSLTFEQTKQQTCCNSRVLQVPVRSSPSSSGCPVAVDRLSCAQSDPRLLLASCSDGTLKLFDLRASLAPVASIHAGKGGLAGMVLEPCGRPGTIVTGELRLGGLWLVLQSRAVSNMVCACRRRRCKACCGL